MIKRLLLVVTILLLSTTSALAAKWEWDANDYQGQDQGEWTKLGGDVIAEVTYKFTNGKTGSDPLYAITGENPDETIEKFLQHSWQDPFDPVMQFISIDGVPIEETKFAKYGDVIRSEKLYGYYDDEKEMYVFNNGKVLNKKLGDKTLLPPLYNEKLSSISSSNPKGDGVKVGDTIYRPFELTVTINGKEVVFPDQQPYEDTSAYRAMIPLRAVYEHENVQAIVKWDGKKQTVTAVNNRGQKVIFTIGDKEFLSFSADGSVKKIYSDAAPVVIKGRTYLPLRALGNAWDIQTSWNKDKLLAEMVTPEGYEKYLLNKDQWEQKMKEEK